VDCAHAHFVATGETQACTDPILELERRTETVALDLGALERRDTDACLDIRFHRFTSELVDEDRGQRDAVIARRFVALPVGITGIPVAGQSAYAGLEPAGAEIELRTQAIGHGRLVRLADRNGKVYGMGSRHRTYRECRHCSQGEQFFHENFLIKHCICLVFWCQHI